MLSQILLHFIVMLLSIEKLYIKRSEAVFLLTVFMVSLCCSPLKFKVQLFKIEFCIKRLIKTFKSILRCFETVSYNRSNNHDKKLFLHQ